MHGFRIAPHTKKEKNCAGLQTAAATNSISLMTSISQCLFSDCFILLCNRSIDQLRGTVGTQRKSFFSLLPFPFAVFHKQRNDFLHRLMPASSQHPPHSGQKLFGGACKKKPPVASRSPPAWLAASIPQPGLLVSEAAKKQA